LSVWAYRETDESSVIGDSEPTDRSGGRIFGSGPFVLVDAVKILSSRPASATIADSQSFRRSSLYDRCSAETDADNFWSPH